MNKNNELDGKSYAFCDPKGDIEKCDAITRKTSINEVDLGDHENMTAAIKKQIAQISDQKPIASILFAFNRSQLNAKATKQLKRLLPTLEGKTIKLLGYTDNVGEKSYNTDLALRRAKSIKAFLIKAGFSSGQIITEGYGLCCYVVPNKTAWQRGKNRRVDIVDIHSVE